jgi:hypothetical protein
MAATRMKGAIGEEERGQVALAVQPGRMRPLLLSAFPDAGPHASCEVLDVKYQPSKRCSILYRLGTGWVVGSLRWDGEAEAAEATTTIDPLGMRAYVFPSDPAMPGLPDALRPEAVAAALTHALRRFGPDGDRIVRCRVTPLRYRPGRRCTVRLDLAVRGRAGALGEQVLFGKIYHDRDKGASVYSEMRALADSPPVQQGIVTVAGALAFLPEFPMVVQAPVRGRGLDELLAGVGDGVGLDAGGSEGVRRAAHAMAALHATGLSPKRLRDVGPDLDRMAHRSQPVAAIEPGIGGQMLELAGALAAWLEDLSGWGEEATLVHGDCKPSQFLLDQGSVAVLDFDHCGTADPASDIGTFLASLRQLGIMRPVRRGGDEQARARWVDELEGVFLDAYCVAGERPESFRTRAAWYQALAYLRKAQRAFARSIRSPVPGRLIEQARGCLARLPAPANSGLASTD